MKSKLLVFCMLFFSQELAAQYAVVQPEVFSLTKNSDTPCPESVTGKIYYHIPTNKVRYCGDDFLEKDIMTHWGGNSDIYYIGKVGIGQSPLIYDFDILNRARFNTLFVNEKIGINTNAPAEKLEVVNRTIDIISTADKVLWTMRNVDGGGKFELLGQGLASINVMYGGNISIGTTTNTEKLKVLGDVSYAGSLLVEGKGILANTNANQLVMHRITSIPTIAGFHIDNNTCNTSGFSFENTLFAQAPVVVLGQKNGGTYYEDKLVISIENVTTVGGIIRYCNNSGANIVLSNVTFSLIVIGSY